ncbi:MAG: flagellar hook protein FlgE [Lachnospiraceae bacterium]|nr:flagellar hook protein FlgE [Lachnospiraceae bacterium]
MMRSMYSGVAGLRTHQTKMDVIGNNIANVNTVGYKSMNVTFNELMYQTTQQASGPNAQTNRGGVNARQIGLGVKMGAINTNISQQGATQTTNNPFDIQITGDAFFIVNNGQENFFTRDGSFYVDAAGNLCMTSNGYLVQGWLPDPDDPNSILQTDVTKLQIMAPENLTYAPEATTLGYVSGIVDKNDPSVNSTSGKLLNLQIYDAAGYPYTAKLKVKATDDEGIFSLELSSINDSNNLPIDLAGLTFGALTSVNRTTELNLSTAYTWNADELKDNATGDTVCTVADIKAYLADATTALADPDIAANLQNLAEAYGYDSIEELDNLKVSYVANADTGAKQYVSVLDVLAGTDVSVTPAGGGAAADQNIRDILGLNQADLNLPITSDAVDFQGYTVQYDPTTGLFTGIDGISDTITLELSSLTTPPETTDGPSRFEDVVVDFSTSTMWNNSGTSTLNATNGDVEGLGSGRKRGLMIGISIDTSGMIYGTYDNGMTKLLGQIAVAEFANASGLQKEGDNLYSDTLNSGEFNGIGVDITANGGYMNTGVLEMSNVDLSQEFTEMITTQRGFQANSRIITVSDTLLEELVNLKR